MKRMWHRGRRLKVGDVLNVRDEGGMKRLINDLAKKGIDAKPIYGEMKVEILGFDK